MGDFSAYIIQNLNSRFENVQGSKFLLVSAFNLKKNLKIKKEEEILNGLSSVVNCQSLLYLAYIQ